MKTLVPGMIGLLCVTMQPSKAQTVSPPSDEARIRATENVTGANKSGLAPEQPPSGFITLHGRTYVVTGQQIFPLTRELNFRITPDGLIGVNGQPQKLPSGAMLSPSGQLVAPPQGLQDMSGNPLQMPAFNSAMAQSGFAPLSMAPNPPTNRGAATTSGTNAATGSSAGLQTTTSSPGVKGAGANPTTNSTTNSTVNTTAPGAPNPPGATGGAATGGAATGGAATGGAATGGAATGGAATGGAATGGGATGGPATGGAATSGTGGAGTTATGTSSTGSTRTGTRTGTTGAKGTTGTGSSGGSGGKP